MRSWTESVTEHLSLYGTVDIALDSFPYHGTTTTCEAAWMGVPTVTRLGDRHAARVGGTLLGALGLDELITDSDEAYVEAASALAADTDRLAALRNGLRERMAGSALTDGPAFADRLGRAYRSLWRDWCAARTG